MSNDDLPLQGPTLYLAAINGIIFVITSVLSGSILLITFPTVVYFGFSYPLFIQGFLWTPLTSIFSHSGIAHVGGNMIFLFIYGFKLEEDGISPKQIYVSYLLTGILASFLSVLLLQDFAIQVGASGSVFGILGVVYGVQRKRQVPGHRRVLYSAFILLIFSGTGAHVNAFAHIFGLVIGMVFGQSEYFDRLS